MPHLWKFNMSNPCRTNKRWIHLTCRLDIHSEVNVFIDFVFEKRRRHTTYTLPLFYLKMILLDYQYRLIYIHLQHNVASTLQAFSTDITNLTHSPSVMENLSLILPNIDSSNGWIIEATEASSHQMLARPFKNGLIHILSMCDFDQRNVYTVKPVYNDHLVGYFFAFWSSSRWPRAT